jgi:hypothetical protein
VRFLRTAAFGAVFGCSETAFLARGVFAAVEVFLVVAMAFTPWKQRVCRKPATLNGFLCHFGPERGNLKA